MLYPVAFIFHIRYNVKRDYLSILVKGRKWCKKDISQLRMSLYIDPISRKVVI